MSDINLDSDWFKGRPVFQALKSSKRLLRRGLSPEDLWLKPKEFIKVISEYMINQTEAYDMDFWKLTFGYEGSGKSSINIMQFAEISKNLKIKAIEEIKEKLVFLQTEYAQMIYLFSKQGIFQRPIIIDDAHYIFGKYYGQTSEIQSLLQLARFSRDQQIIHLLNTQVPQQLFADIWKERVNSYEYCFSLNVVDKFGKIKSRNLYVAFYNVENSQLLRLDKIIRLPLFWKKIITRHPPDFITRFDVLFEKYGEIYKTYKFIKTFYKQFYSLLRYLGISKGRYFEMIFKLLSALTDIEPYSNEYKAIITHFIKNLPDVTRRKFYENGLIRKNPKMISEANPEGFDIFPELHELVSRFKDVIKLRTGLSKVSVEEIKSLALQEYKEKEILKLLKRLKHEEGSAFVNKNRVYQFLKEHGYEKNEISEILKKLHEKGYIAAEENNIILP